MEIIIKERSNYSNKPTLVVSADARFAWNAHCDGTIFLTGFEPMPEGPESKYPESVYHCQDFSNHGRDVSGLKEDLRAFNRAIYKEVDAAEKAHEEARTAAEMESERSNRYMPHVTGEDRRRKAAEYDAINNEGGEGFNPWTDL